MFDSIWAQAITPDLSRVSKPFESTRNRPAAGSFRLKEVAYHFRDALSFWQMCRLSSKSQLVKGMDIMERKGSGEKSREIEAAAQLWKVVGRQDCQEFYWAPVTCTVSRSEKPPRLWKKQSNSQFIRYQVDSSKETQSCVRSCSRHVLPFNECIYVNRERYNAHDSFLDNHQVSNNHHASAS
jgi:hypothetical protein